MPSEIEEINARVAKRRESVRERRLNRAAAKEQNAAREDAARARMRAAAQRRARRAAAEAAAGKFPQLVRQASGVSATSEAAEGRARPSVVLPDIAARSSASQVGKESRTAARAARARKRRESREQKEAERMRVKVRRKKSKHSALTQAEAEALAKAEEAARASRDRLGEQQSKERAKRYAKVLSTFGASVKRDLRF